MDISIFNLNKTAERQENRKLVFVCSRPPLGNKNEMKTEFFKFFENPFLKFLQKKFKRKISAAQLRQNTIQKRKINLISENKFQSYVITH